MTALPKWLKRSPSLAQRRATMFRRRTDAEMVRSWASRMPRCHFDPGPRPADTGDWLKAPTPLPLMTERDVRTELNRQCNRLRGNGGAQ